MLAVSLLWDLLYYLIYFNIFKKVSFVLDTWFLFFLLQGKICTNSDQQEKHEIFDSFDILLFH